LACDVGLIGLLLFTLLTKVFGFILGLKLGSKSEEIQLIAHLFMGITLVVLATIQTALIYRIHCSQSKRFSQQGFKL